MAKDYWTFFFIKWTHHDPSFIFWRLFILWLPILTPRFHCYHNFVYNISKEFLFLRKIGGKWKWKGDTPPLIRTTNNYALEIANLIYPCEKLRSNSRKYNNVKSLSGPLLKYPPKAHTLFLRHCPFQEMLEYYSSSLAEFVSYYLVFVVQLKRKPYIKRPDEKGVLLSKRKLIKMFSSSCVIGAGIAGRGGGGGG